MTTDQPRVGQQRPGGRAARVRAAILEAVFDLLADVGYERLSIDEVAQRAGVHKTTVYRRWPTKAELVMDSACESSVQNVPIPDMGTLHGDLQQLARGVVSNIGTEPGSQTTLAIVAAAAASPELASSLHTFWAERLTLSAPIIERAKARGELPPSADANLIIQALIGPIWIRLLLTGETIDQDLADQTAALIADLVRPTISTDRPV